jgi:serine/threonine-protein kinase
VLWKEIYEREIKDVFAVQDDITRSIVAALRVQLGGAAAPAGNQQGTSDLEAYDLYLRGLQGYRKRGAALVPAEHYLSQAIARDPGFARAYALLASVLLVEPYFISIPPGEVLPRARAAAERAVALNPGLAEAHQALGHVHTESFEWGAAEVELRQAVALDPNRAEAQYRLGFMLFSSGRTSEAIAAFQQAKSIDPFYPIPASYLGWALAVGGHGEQGVAEAYRAFELDSTSEAVQAILTGTVFIAGRREEAVGLARRFLTTTSAPRRLGNYAALLAMAGARGEAEAILGKLEAVTHEPPGLNAGLACTYLGLGDTTRALHVMERAAAADGDLLLGTVPTNALYDPVRKSPRFAAVMKRFNLDPAGQALGAEAGRP